MPWIFKTSVKLHKTIATPNYKQTKERDESNLVIMYFLKK